jgi:signal transduction histidine kinase
MIKNADNNASSQALDLRHPELEAMLRGLLHELRNPLSSIITASTLLQDAALPSAVEISEEGQMLLDVIKKESLRLNHILTEFAGYIKLPAPAPQRFDLYTTASEAVRALQATGVLPAEISIENRLEKPCVVNADESQIRQALQHLMKNAAEEMPGGGTLALTSIAGATAANAGVCLSDSGRGFSSESRERAFQPFYSTKGHSIGLGLSAVRSIIEAAGGRVWIADDGAGSEATRVCFELPRGS